jgi:chlorobactene glucosyltransferase
LFPGAVSAAVAEAVRRAAPVFSVLTHQQLPTVWERIFMPAIFGSLAQAMPIEFVNDPRLPQFAIANGQFLLVRRDVYEAMGGHEAIKDEIGEDARFAQRAKQLGWRYWLADGRQLATTRMYTTPRALWEGWTKNLHVGARLLPWIIPPGIVFYTISLASPFMLLARSIRRRTWVDAVAGSIQLASALYERRGMDRIYSVPPIYAFTYPLGQVGFLALLGASFYKILTGRGVTWKGRRYYARS